MGLHFNKINTNMSSPMGISRILSTASRVRAWAQPNSASFSQTIALTSPVGKKVKQETLEEELARKKSAAYSKKDEPIHLPFNAVFEDEVEQLYAEVEERRRAMAQANVSRSFYGNTRSKVGTADQQQLQQQ